MTGRPRGNLPGDYGYVPPAKGPLPRSLASSPDELPDRLKVGAPGFGRYAGRITVFLDGQEVKRCTEFDVGKGFVRVQRTDSEGRIFLENDAVAQEILRGRVEVRWK